MQLAVLSGHFELGEIIKNHKDSDIGKIPWQLFLLQGLSNVTSQHLSALLFPKYIILTMYLFSPSLSSCHTSHIHLYRHTKPLHHVMSLVPFLESPKFVPKRKESSHTLPLPLLHSHPLLRANSDNTMTQSDPLALPNKAATNPNPGQVLSSIRWMSMF